MIIDLAKWAPRITKIWICEMNTQDERGDRADCLDSKFSSKENLGCARVAYSVPEQHKLVAQSLYPRRSEVPGLVLNEPTLQQFRVVTGTTAITVITFFSTDELENDKNEYDIP